MLVTIFHDNYTIFTYATAQATKSKPTNQIPTSIQVAIDNAQYAMTLTRIDLGILAPALAFVFGASTARCPYAQHALHYVALQLLASSVGSRQLAWYNRSNRNELIFEGKSSVEEMAKACLAPSIFNPYEQRIEQTKYS